MMRSSGPDVVGQVLDGTPRDDQLHVAQSLEIVERIPRHGNHVGVLPHLEGAKAVAGAMPASSATARMVMASSEVVIASRTAASRIS
jgi:hypothetical protein